MFDFGKHLKEVRQTKNISQKQLAIEIGASERGIQNYELGERKPTYDMLVKLADYFDCSVDYLVGRTNCPDIIMKREDGTFMVVEVMSKSKDE